MARRPVAPVRAVSILMGIMIGCILAYAYQINLPTLFYEMNIATLVVFLSIPAFSGFIVGLLNPATALKDGLIVGLVTGLFNSIVAAVKMIFVSTLALSEVYAFSLFAIMAVFAWTILAAAAAVLAKRFYE
ncbi:MAG: hypothetical protein QXE06_10195 [Candidatus Bathyarchaeia archaeon]